MKTIFACKLYRSSTRKSKIQAALANPINVELVTQLSEYLDDEYKPMAESNIDANPVDDSNTDSKSAEPNESAMDSNSVEPTHPPQGGSPIGKLSKKYGEALDSDGNAAFDATQGDTEQLEGESADTDDSVSSNITLCNHGSIMASEASMSVSPNFLDALTGLAVEIKGTLNSRIDTIGVNRVALKGDELWVYYNDDINLNNTMAPVIELLNAANYHYLIFNRLARTDNAIVFTINEHDTNNIMESMSNV